MGRAASMTRRAPRIAVVAALAAGVIGIAGHPHGAGGAAGVAAAQTQIRTPPQGTIATTVDRCAGAQDAATITHMLATADPDSLTPEQSAFLGCLDAGLWELSHRYPEPPSWELLREIRGRYHALGREPCVVAALTRLLASRSPGVACAALRALVLYGDAALIARLREECGSRGLLMHLAVAGDTSAVTLGIERYRAGRAAHEDEGESRRFGIRDKLQLIDAVYYLGTKRGTEFLIDVAVSDPDPLVRIRADSMLVHPAPADGALTRP
jgi:hypothetical protein